VDTKFGFPVVDAQNLDEFIQKSGLVPWQRIGEPQQLESYLKIHVDSAGQLLKHIPKFEVTTFLDPDDQPFAGIRYLRSDAVVVFVVLPGDFVVVCAEFKHGIEEISINLPGGGNLNQKPPVCAVEEVKEETGLVLSNVQDLSPLGISNDASQTPNRTHYFLAKVNREPVLTERNLDAQEFVLPFLMPIKEWLTLIKNNRIIDGQSVICTFLALSKLNRIIP